MKPMFITEKETVVKSVLRYETFDGKVFVREDECKEYEKALKLVRETEFKALCAICSEDELFRCGCCDYTIYLVEITNQNVMNIVNKYLECFVDRDIYSSKKRFTKDDIGTIQMIEDCEGCLDLMGSTESYAQVFLGLTSNKVKNRKALI